MTTQMQYLFEQLHSNDAQKRSHAILRLSEVGNNEAIDALIEVLRSDNEVFVQEDATWALCRFGSVAIESLIVLLNDSSEMARHNAAHTLGKMGDVQAVDALIHALQDSSERVRHKAAYALGQIGDERAIFPLVNLLGDAHLEVRYTVGDVLLSFGEAVIEALGSALAHEVCDVRELAAGLLGEIATENTVEALVLALHDECWEVRCAAIQALGMMDDKQMIVVLEQVTEQDENERVRNLATVMLRRMRQLGLR